LATIPSMTVTRTNDEKVKLLCCDVDRDSLRVVIEISEYNARFVFCDIGGRISLALDGRQIIDPSKKAVPNVSRSVYLAMVRWVGSILHDRREQIG